MSYPLLEKIATHLRMAGLLDGIETKYYRCVDEDMKGSTNIAVFRMAGGGGPRNSVVQQPDVKVILYANAKDIIDMNGKADAIFKYFGGLTAPEGVLKLEPLAAVMGPYFAENNRPVFEINIRCFVQDM